MNDDDNIILYAEATSKGTVDFGLDKDGNYRNSGGHINPHEPVLASLLVLPKVGFTALHNVDAELTLTRLPCSKETAERWVEEMRAALKDRFIWAEIKEVLI